MSSPQGLTDLQRRLIAATQAGLPLTPHPYQAIANQLGLSEALVIKTLQDMLQRGLIRRIGAVPNHYRLGYTANGMSVWDVDEAQVDELGQAVGHLPFVSHCYRRPRHAPVWPYNLFAMVHGHTREEVEAQAEQIRQLLGSALRGHDILYSSQILKKTGLRLRDAQPAKE
ncbi:MAG: Lrp/AsnC family transcriptional regulator [Burkholderiales bacterium]|nr:Lrp/AsnC family transcriptional regulator [Burkholderiales bacterium]